MIGTKAEGYTRTSVRKSDIYTMIKTRCLQTAELKTSYDCAH